TYAAGAGDTLTETAINDSNNNSVPGVPYTPPTNKTYVFTPSAPGTYTFYPAARSMYYPGWDNYGASLVVTVGGVCSPGDTSPACACATGFARNQAGVCVPIVAACTGPNEVGTPPSCNCEIGYSRVGGVCAPASCTGANEVNPPACTCAAGYQRDQGICARIPELSILANGETSARVLRGTPVVLTWSATGVQEGTCGVRNALSGTLLYSGDNSPNPAPSPAVSAQTTYRLSCLTDTDRQVSAEVTVSIIPSYNEI
ncbi:MAG: hypothetical protein AAB964_00895, partial [Patescibacteria group bacterium]